MEAKIYHPNGEIEDVLPKNGKHFTLEEMQAIVGGYIEIVRLPANLLMILNEEGKLQKLAYNPHADAIFKNHFHINNNYIVGNVLICSKIYVT